MKSLSRVRLFVIPWTVALQASLSMGFFQARVLEWGAIAFSREVIKALKKGDHMDFPGDPMFKTSPSKAESMGFIPG